MTDHDPLLRYRFTMRQRQVLEGVGAGKSYAALARELDLGYETVVTYAKQVHALIGYTHLAPKAAIRQFHREVAA